MPCLGAIHTKWESNPQPSNYESWTWTITPQCSQCSQLVGTVIQVLWVKSPSNQSLADENLVFCLAFGCVQACSGWKSTLLWNRHAMYLDVSRPAVVENVLYCGTATPCIWMCPGLQRLKAYSTVAPPRHVSGCVQACSGWKRTLLWHRHAMYLDVSRPAVVENVLYCGTAAPCIWMCPGLQWLKSYSTVAPPRHVSECVQACSGWNRTLLWHRHAMYLDVSRPAVVENVLYCGTATPCIWMCPGLQWLKSYSTVAPPRHVSGCVQACSGWKRTLLWHRHAMYLDVSRPAVVEIVLYCGTAAPCIWMCPGLQRLKTYSTVAPLRHVSGCVQACSGWKRTLLWHRYAMYLDAVMIGLQGRHWTIQLLL